MSGGEDDTTRELRLDQIERARAERAAADRTPVPDEAATHERRAERADYLREKLEDRARAEREAAD